MGCKLLDWCHKPGKDHDWLCPVCQKADLNKASFMDDTTGQAFPRKVPGLLDCTHDRFKYRYTRALKQFDEYLHAFRQWCNEGRSNTGAVVHHHTTPWAIHDILLVATSEEYGKWAHGVFKLEVKADGYWAPFEEWNSWRGTGRAGPRIKSMEPAIVMDDEERESGGPNLNDLFGMDEAQACTPTVGSNRQSRGHRVVDTEENRLDVDLLARPGTKVQFVQQRRTMSPLMGKDGRGGEGDGGLYEEGVEELELDGSNEAFESDQVCSP